MDIEKTGKIRVGVVGVGYLGRHHARLYHELSEVCELVGVVEEDRDRGEEICELYNCELFESLDDLAAACDAVSVVVPTDRHRDVAVPLLQKGVDLLIEKPICSSREEAAQILAAAKASGAIVQVGHIEHFNPVMSFLEEAVCSPRYITADRLAPYQLRGTEVGVVLDLMIHDIGIILELVKSPIEHLDAVGVNVVSQTEDIANARIRFKNGCVANINTSRVSQKKLREIRVFQPRKYLSLDFMNQSGHLLQINGTSLDRDEIPIDKGEPLKLELSSFLDSVRKSQTPRVDASFGSLALEVALDVTELIQSQQAAMGEFAQNGKAGL
ncbi:MAG: Gfo/Idh/MocA family oxidoreductase [Puniceicoccaceae bacterium]